MPRGLSLSEIEKGRIQSYKSMGFSNRRIAKEIGRNPTVVDNFVNLGQFYGKTKRPGRKPTISKRMKNAIIEKCRKEHCTSSEIKADLNVPTTTRRIRQILQQSEKVKWLKRKKKPKLKPHHKQARLKFAKKHMHWRSEWQNVIFSDEKNVT